MLGFIPVQNFIGKGTKADYMTNIMIISASGCKQQTSLKMHIGWDVILCCSPNGTAAHMLRLVSSPTPLKEPYLLQQITCSTTDSYTSTGFLAFNETGMCAYHLLYNSNFFHFSAPCLSLQLSHTHIMANVSGLDYTNSFFQEGFHPSCSITGSH
jgi:hypothetical protein